MNKSILLCLPLIVCAISGSAAGNVVNEGIIGGTYPTGYFGDNFGLTVFQEYHGTYTGVSFKYMPTQLQAINWNVDEESDWYLAPYGSAFGPGPVNNPPFTPIFTTDHAWGPVNIPQGDFYLGVNTGVGFSSSGPNRNVFGWVKLRNTGTDLLVVDQAMAYGDPGIVIGQMLATPEPATLSAMALGGLLLLRKSRWAIAGR